MASERTSQTGVLSSLATELGLKAPEEARMEERMAETHELEARELERRELEQREREAEALTAKATAAEATQASLARARAQEVGFSSVSGRQDASLPPVAVQSALDRQGANDQEFTRQAEEHEAEMRKAKQDAEARPQGVLPVGAAIAPPD
ncbi:hypothetical protein [Rhizobium sp. SSA_523]|uniref:hypothetical protein n=1 Tax=Rhizobium sp. SSA_523 TaxID=2952477 RepID=UPI00209132F5|nr:hypothetical protein [Rhizobium sp. SSA_523]MCO5733770.1 hypothetical protein [Rhizobium sp. SSA_523]WKC24955.1 hypothetical protein QTJ18_13190 [Rhizobium sp. SSA_523]